MVCFRFVGRHQRWKLDRHGHLRPTGHISHKGIWTGAKPDPLEFPCAHGVFNRPRLSFYDMNDRPDADKARRPPVCTGAICFDLFKTNVTGVGVFFPNRWDVWLMHQYFLRFETANQVTTFQCLAAWIRKTICSIDSRFWFDAWICLNSPSWIPLPCFTLSEHVWISPPWGRWTWS